jgi:ABC-type uncharacterized transport system involved in gliding motility auxiliary subunit
MAANNPEAKPKKAPRINRFAIGLNVLVQIVLVFFILAFINYFAFKHFKRWDFSREHKYALSDQTKRVLEGLPKPVKIFVFFSEDPRIPGGDVYTDVTSLLKEYQYAAKGNVEVEEINPYRNLSRAKELMAHYKFGNENVVVVDYQGHSKLVNATDMAQYDDSVQTTDAPPKLKAFNGEQPLTAAILEVSEEKQNKIYLIGGKGGPELSGDGLAVLKTYMERQNLTLDTLTLMNVDKVPDDAKALMLIGATYDLTDREMKLLHDYWDKQGRLFIALDPSGHTPKLADFLRELGINPQDDRVLRTMAMGPVTGIVRDVEAIFSDSSPVTKRLQGVDTVFLGETQSLGAFQVPGVAADSLVTAGEGYWGETKYQDMETTGVSYDPKEDISAPLTLAASVEKGALPDASVNIETSRLIVTGNADFMTSAAFSQAQANLDFVMAGLNWLLNREDKIGIVPKDEHQFTLNLTDEQMHRIELLVMVMMPASVLMVGAFVWMQRRR